MSRLFDDLGEGFITVSRFRVRSFEYNVAILHFYNVPMQCNVVHFFNMLKLQAILKEIDENFTDDEIDDIILDVSS